MRHGSREERKKGRGEGKNERERGREQEMKEGVHGDNKKY